MSSSDFFYGLGDLFTLVLSPFDTYSGSWGLTSIMNTLILLTGFVGLGIWLNKQRKFNNAAKANPNQRK
jgi:hypothetical protein